MLFRTFLLLVALVALVQADSCNPNASRTDCGYVGINQDQCEAKGCCWSPADNLPWCFYTNAPTNNYIVQNVSKTSAGLDIALTLSNSPATFGPDVSNVHVLVTFDTDDRLRVRIVDSSNSRWEVPEWLSPLPQTPSTPAANPLYSFVSAPVGSPFWFAVVRVSTGKTIFNTSSSDTFAFNGLVFEDQYLEISTQLPTPNYIYGIGEHVHALHLDPNTYTLWSFDTPTPYLNNLYGAHPFYVEMRDGNTHGVFLRNSNGMDVSVTSNSITYHVIGGVLDFFFFLGPSPSSVVSQYTEVIGRPHMPPFWGLGFHQCRYGYPNLAALQTVVSQYAANEIPLDTMWTDIDYMDSYKDFTWSPTNFPQAQMSDFVNSLHNNSMQYVVIVDPGIANTQGYPPYDEGVQLNLFIKKADNQTDFVGKVWPGLTVFPDFFNPNSFAWWQNQIKNFLAGVAVDGLWIDMNEISNFCNGACAEKPQSDEQEQQQQQQQQQQQRDNSTTQQNQNLKFNPNTPPYAINNQQSHTALNVKTLDMDTLHYGGVLEYNAHNLFGLSEALATSAALEAVKKERSFIISRSTFPGSGRVTGHWTGDNHATWDDLYYSISGMLNFQLFGIPLVGSDICGFMGDTTEELCGRWMQLGSFYPFSRNHNTLGAAPQEPYTWPSVAAISRTTLGIRYSLLSYYYTLFYFANTQGTTVTRSLWFEFPEDANTFNIDRQFLVGSNILISPVLTQGASTVSAYFPGGVWYDWYTGAVNVSSPAQGTTVTLQAPFDFIPIHIRANTITPVQTPGLTSAASLASDFTLVVATNASYSGSAVGFLYLDDGVTVDTTSYLAISYSAQYTADGSGSLLNQVTDTGFSASATQKLSTIRVLGVVSPTKQVTINGASSNSFFYDSTNKVLTISIFNTPIYKSLTVSWSN